MKIISEKIKSDLNENCVDLKKLTDVINDINYSISLVAEEELKKLADNTKATSLEVEKLKNLCKQKGNSIQSLLAIKDKEKMKKEVLLNFIGLLENYQVDKSNIDQIIVFVNKIDSCDIEKLKQQNSRLIKLHTKQIISN